MHFLLKFTLPILILVTLYACSNNSSSTKSIEWENTKWEQLENESIWLRLPNQFKRSSRYRIKEDVRDLAEDTAKLRLVQESIERLEFEDAEIDVFVDTSKSNRMLFICNTREINFSKNDIAILKQQLKMSNEENQINNPDFEFEKLSAMMKANDNFKLARLLNQIRNRKDNSKVYHSIYYLTGKSFTLMVYEFSEDAESIEKYLWTAKT